MRSRALIISWFRYHPRVGEGHRVMWEHWLKTFPQWSSNFDAFYLIDQGMDFTPEDEKRLKEILPNSQILKSEVDGHHWEQFKWVIPKIKEDNMLFLDNDVVMTDGDVVDSWFRLIEVMGAKFVGSFDGSGGLQEIIKEKYPIMRTFGNRMGSYYFILTRGVLDAIPDYSFEPNQFKEGTVIHELDDYVTKEGDWLDSFGLFTLKMLHAGVRMAAIPDPRDTIYLQLEPGNTQDPDFSKDASQWVISKEPEQPEHLGYYHIRNGNLANYIMSSWFAGNREDYFREISSVKREILRSLAWYVYMDEHNKSLTDVLHLLGDLGLDLETWDNYMKEFKEYHKLP